MGLNSLNVLETLAQLLLLLKTQLFSGLVKLEVLQQTDWLATLRREKCDGNFIARFYGVPRPTSTGEFTRAQGFTGPMDRLAVLLIYIKIDLRVWIDKIELGHCPVQRDGLGLIICGISMVSKGGNGSDSK